MATKKTDTIIIPIEIDENGLNRLNDNINETVQVTKSLKSQLKEMTLELQNIEPGTARFYELTAAAGQLKDQINCPSAAFITATINKRNLLATQINGIYNQVKTLTSLQNTSGQIITIVTIGINLISAAPPQTVPGAFIVNHEKLANALKKIPDLWIVFKPPKLASLSNVSKV